VILGAPLGGSEKGVGHSKSLGILWDAQVLRLPIDMVAGVAASVSIDDVEH